MQVAAVPVGHRAAERAGVIGQTAAGSAMVHVARTLACFQHILAPSQVLPHCPRPGAQNFEKCARKSSRRKSRQERGPFNGNGGLLRGI